MPAKQLTGVGSLVAKSVDGGYLTRHEAARVFETVFKYDKHGYYLLALISAMHARGESSEELAGMVDANLKLATKLKLRGKDKNNVLQKLTDLSGSGGGQVKTFNVSTTASFIVAAAGMYILKNTYWAVTGITGSADIFEAFGILIRELTKHKIVKMLQTGHIAPVYLPLISPKLQNRAEALNIIFKQQGLRIRTPFHIVSNIVSALPIKRRIYGIYSKKYLNTIAQLFVALRFEHTLTFFGEPGLPEISNVGKTYIAEQRNNEIKTYVLLPRDLGVKKRDIAEIKTHSKQENVCTFLQILLGKMNGAKADLAFINTGASLYVMGLAKSIKDGVLKAQELVANGKAFEILKILVTQWGNVGLLEWWLDKCK